MQLPTALLRDVHSSPDEDRLRAVRILLSSSSLLWPACSWVTFHGARPADTTGRPVPTLTDALLRLILRTKSFLAETPVFSPLHPAGKTAQFTWAVLP